MNEAMSIRLLLALYCWCWLLKLGKYKLILEFGGRRFTNKAMNIGPLQALCCWCWEPDNNNESFEFGRVKLHQRGHVYWSTASSLLGMLRLGQYKLITLVWKLLVAKTREAMRHNSLNKEKHPKWSFSLFTCRNERLWQLCKKEWVIKNSATESG